MPAKVTLSISQGKLLGQEFVFDERTTCVMGRAADCSPRLPDDGHHTTIGRHHCLLDINPPDIRIRDFGSLNGTFINGALIGQREAGQTPDEGAKLSIPEHDLKAGDKIQLGDTVFDVGIFVHACCAECAVEIPEAHKAQAERLPGIFQCDACRQRAERAKIKAPPRPKAKVCSVCGRDVAAEMGHNRQGDFVCAKCQADPLQVVQRLLEFAKSQSQDFPEIRNYTLVRELGRGGMGAVFLARHHQTGQQVALKVMLPQVAVEDHAKQLFLREAMNTRALRHPNLVQPLDCGASQGTFFFTLEYCNGGSVDRLMRQRGGTLERDEAVPIILQALDGLHHAHTIELPVLLKDRSQGRAVGLLHRDLKPHNLLLSGAGATRVAKVADFGLSKAFDIAGLSGQTRTGAIAGTPYFMPRQQVVNFKFAKPEVDVWAMAASLYFILTGFPPRDFLPGRNPFRTVLQTDAVPIRQRDGSIPARLAKVIDEALADNPDITFKSALELKKALEAAC